MHWHIAGLLIRLPLEVGRAAVLRYDARYPVDLTTVINLIVDCDIHHCLRIFRFRLGYGVVPNLRLFFVRQFPSQGHCPSMIRLSVYETAGGLDRLRLNVQNKTLLTGPPVDWRR